MKGNFDDFLKEEISKSTTQIPDDGFSDQVIANLPKRDTVFTGREIIITISTIISALVFVLIKGFNPFLTGIINLFNSLIHLKIPNYEFVIVLMAFCLISILIPYIEFRKRIL
jgi:hypothetical protein